MKSIRQWFSKFMYGRYGSYGNDKLNTCLLWVSIGLMLLEMLLGLIAGESLALRLSYYIVSAASLALIFVIFFRIFSRNINKRRRENQRLLDYLKLRAAKKRDRKTHVYRRCPRCHAVLRLPKSRGKHTAVCPRCSERFEVRG